MNTNSVELRIKNFNFEVILGVYTAFGIFLKFCTDGHVLLNDQTFDLSPFPFFFFFSCTFFPCFTDLKLFLQLHPTNLYIEMLSGQYTWKVTASVIWFLCHLLYSWMWMVVCYSFFFFFFPPGFTLFRQLFFDPDLFPTYFRQTSITQCFLHRNKDWDAYHVKEVLKTHLKKEETACPTISWKGENKKCKTEMEDEGWKKAKNL